MATDFRWDACLTPEEEDRFLFAAQIKYLQERFRDEPIPEYDIAKAVLHRATYFPPRDKAHDASSL
jgi:hypothetical protein